MLKRTNRKTPKENKKMREINFIMKPKSLKKNLFFFIKKKGIYFKNVQKWQNFISLYFKMLFNC